MPFGTGGLCLLLKRTVPCAGGVLAYLQGAGVPPVGTDEAAYEKEEWPPHLEGKRDVNSSRGFPLCR